ncbi:hypothetical protein B0J15DRAFT_514235 [Fusarium solani]|uniref:Uncharacterized protein n=1 Tax=Fusarium solani TaxID=169388 RepID=A0A9P9K4Z1_FUSSL|nr:uncharacterized protein B0J15DRAFT_514235 [Fusarium solani]KAH7249552.1 hypothetical protein B0J15DRAFT_514235 [Fusarium solani]
MPRPMYINVHNVHRLAVHTLYTVLVLAGHLLQAFAETLPSLACAAGSEVTAHPECDSFLSSNDVCATVMDRPGKEDCLCHQECENELRLCYRREDLGVNFDRARELWNSLCGSVITFDPTTAPPSSYEPYPDQLCQNIKTRCAEARKLLRECTDYTSDKDTSRLSSCTCRPTLLREAYSCAYVANTTCLGLEATLSNVHGYQCDNFESVIGTGLPDFSPATETAFPTLDITTAMTGSSSESTATATTTSDNASVKENPRFGTVMMFALCSLFLISVL